jgi:hypothetical protein
MHVHVIATPRYMVNIQTAVSPYVYGTISPNPTVTIVTIVQYIDRKYFIETDIRGGVGLNTVLFPCTTHSTRPSCKTQVCIVELPAAALYETAYQRQATICAAQQ